MTKQGFCIYVNALIDGQVPLEWDDNGNAFVYLTQLEAERVIAEETIERCQQFLDGERTFEDATTIEEYVVKVEVMSNGSIRDDNNRYFGRGEHR